MAPASGEDNKLPDVSFRGAMLVDPAAMCNLEDGVALIPTFPEPSTCR